MRPTPKFKIGQTVALYWDNDRRFTIDSICYDGHGYSYGYTENTEGSQPGCWPEHELRPVLHTYTSVLVHTFESGIVVCRIGADKVASSRPDEVETTSFGSGVKHRTCWFDSMEEACDFAVKNQTYDV